MRKKLNSESGLTLVEMLCAVIILILLGLLLNTGLQMTVRTYRAITAQSEVELLLSTAVDALADDLRYARGVSESGGSVIYTSDSFGTNTRLTLDEQGQIMANGLRVLPTGAYGLNGAYQVSQMDISYEDSVFQVTLKVETTDANQGIGAETTFYVRCLNPEKETTGGGT